MVHLLHNSETPASVYAVLEGNKTVALVADNLFDLLMLKMSDFYQPKKQTRIESRGPRFEAGDFLVKLGSVTMGPVFKGILIEVGTPRAVVVVVVDDVFASLFAPGPSISLRGALFSALESGPCRPATLLTLSIRRELTRHCGTVGHRLQVSRSPRPGLTWSRPPGRRVPSAYLV